MPFALVLFFIVTFSVTDLHGMTIDEAVCHALRNNSDLQSLRIEEEVAQAQLVKARLLLISNPNIEGSFSREEKLPEEGTGHFSNYGVRLSQEFEVAGQRTLRIDMAEKDITKIGLEIKDKERTVTGDAKDTFTRVLTAKKKVELASEMVRLQEELIGFTKLKFQAGDISGLEENLAEVELGKAKKDFLAAKREYRLALLALQGLIGIKTDPAMNVEGETLPDDISLPDKGTLSDRMTSLLPDLKAAAIEIQRFNKAVDLAKKGAVPNITLSGFYDREENRSVIGLSLSFPIPLIDRKETEKREAQARAKQALIRYAGLEKIKAKEFDEAYSNLESAIEEVAIFRREIMSKIKENLNLMNLAFQEGKIGFFEVMVAQKDTMETRLSYLDLLLRTQLAVNALERVIGGPLK